MNCSQSKKISIIGYLENLGIRPQKIKNGSAWYSSPLRNETKPSFKVFHSQNIWYDYALGKGGNILDLVMEMNNTGIAGALMILQKPELIIRDFSFFEQQSSPDSAIQIKKIQPLQNRALIQYLASRKISHFKAINFISEAYYQVNGKNYFALAFMNDKGGFELRNKYFKGSNSPKAITTIKGSLKRINIFEGFLDFLSALEYYGYKKPAATTIVLNSINNLDAVSSLLPKFRRINLYLDNDPAGKNAAEGILKKFPNATNFAKTIYPNNKDFNEFIINTQPSLV